MTVEEKSDMGQTVWAGELAVVGVGKMQVVEGGVLDRGGAIEVLGGWGVIEVLGGWGVCIHIYEHIRKSSGALLLLDSYVCCRGVGSC